MAEWKATAAESAKRVDEVKRLLLVGKTRCEILPICTSWGIGDEQADNYIKKARLELQEINKADFQENRYLVLKNLWETYQRALEANNLKEQRGCLTQISKITGIEMAPAEQSPRLPEMSDAELDQAWQQEAVH